MGYKRGPVPLGELHQVKNLQRPASGLLIDLDSRLSTEPTVLAEVVHDVSLRLERIFLYRLLIESRLNNIEYCLPSLNGDLLQIGVGLDLGANCVSGARSLVALGEYPGGRAAYSTGETQRWLNPLACPDLWIAKVRRERPWYHRGKILYLRRRRQ